MRLITPKRFVDPGLYPTTPLVFLAGPILGGGNWQLAMCRLLDEAVPDLLIAVPLRLPELAPLADHCLGGAEGKFDRQLAWERYYLREAAARGCVLFWLAEQVAPREDGSPYARDTLGELGEWRGHLHYRKDYRVVIGGDPSFPGLDMIRRNYEDLVPGFTICPTMYDAVAAVRRCLDARRYQATLLNLQ